MARDPRYDPLFEPLKIGPVTAPNRFYQVPHCSGMGFQRPQMMAAMRGVKAEGGWGVVCTEYCSIHASSDDSPYSSASLCDDDDVRNLRLMTDAVHAHGSLAGVELWYGGHTSPNLYTREVALDVASLPNINSQSVDDHYYLGSAIALKFCSAGVKVSMVTPESSLAGWSHHTEEHSLTMRALIEAVVEIVTAKGLVGWQSGELQLQCIYSGRESTIEADYLVPISARIPRDDLWRELDAHRDEFDTMGGLSLQRVGDCRAPGIIAAAVYAGHKAAREPGYSEVEFKRDRVVV